MSQVWGQKEGQEDGEESQMHGVLLTSPGPVCKLREAMADLEWENVKWGKGGTTRPISEINHLPFQIRHFPQTGWTRAGALGKLPG
jgi:hypothetical protein